MSSINYWNPVQEAWNKMVAVLFRPFDLGKWFVIGVAAFLSTCGREGGGGGRGGSGGRGSSGDLSGEDFRRAVSQSKDFVADVWAEYAVAVMIVASLLILFVVGMIVLTNWLNSRGQFMFLDNLVKNRAAVAEPWREYRRESNSLMGLQILIGVLCAISVIVVIVQIAMLVFPMIIEERFIMESLPSLIALIALLVILGFLFSAFSGILHHFVVPLMYRNRGSVRDGFAAFMPLFKQNFWRFVLFGLVMMVVDFAVGFVVVFAGLCTCCIGFFIMAIPYLGTVILLPIHVFRRFVGPEFLRQFGDEFDVLDDSIYQGNNKISDEFPALPEG